MYEGADDAGNCLGVCQDGSMAPNCHYGKQAFPEGKGDTANSYISNIQVPGAVDHVLAQWTAGETACQTILTLYISP